MDQNQERRRGGHFHRSRRGADRRGHERRTPPAQEPRRDGVDVEQIMRDIRARIATRNGIELSDQQIQDLAARRLESILDPRAVRPALLDELKRGAAAPAEKGSPAPEPAYTFEDTTLYESHRGILRFIRKLLNPLLKLFFNPNPLIRALNTQARLNVEAAQREAERERRQAEWNALQYEIVQRLVTEVSRVSLEMQALTMRVESLSAKVDFNERRVRAMEGAAHQPRPSRQPVHEAPPPVMPVAPETVAGEAGAETGGPAGVSSEGPRRRRRRRRGRRGGGAVAGEAGATPPEGATDGGADSLDDLSEDGPLTAEQAGEDGNAVEDGNAPADSDMAATSTPAPEPEPPAANETTAVVAVTGSPAESPVSVGPKAPDDTESATPEPQPESAPPADRPDQQRD